MAERLADIGAMTAHFDGQGAYLEPEKETPAEIAARDAATQLAATLCQPGTDGPQTILNAIDEGLSVETIRVALQAYIQGRDDLIMQRGKYSLTFESDSMVPGCTLPKAMLCQSIT